MLVGHRLLIEAFTKFSKSGTLSHAYLFFGPEGVGKRFFALSLANFLERGEFDYDEAGSKVFNDLLVLRPDGNKTIGIEPIRGVKSFLYRRPNLSSRRTVVIDGAEFLTTEAQNALLKITEEPPESALLVLIARDHEILMPTLSSRLQKVFFSSLDREEVEGWLVSAQAVPAKKAKELAGKSKGAPGLALRFLKDEGFVEVVSLAEKFLAVSGSGRRDFIKKLIDPPVGGEDFDVLGFLDALIIVVANSEKMNYNLWHRVLELRKNISNFSLNPRLQLEALV